MLFFSMFIIPLPIMTERGVDVDHATLNRWVVRYSPRIAEQAQKRKRPTRGSWRVDETYIKVKMQAFMQ